MQKPTQQPNPDLSQLLPLCHAYIDWVASDDFVEEKLLNWDVRLAEKLIEIVYGVDVFEWINERIDADKESPLEKARQQYQKYSDPICDEEDDN